LYQEIVFLRPSCNSRGSKSGRNDFNLVISEEGFAELRYGPFIDSMGDGVPGKKVTIHLKDNNITEYTGTDGYAIFHITYPVEYGEYLVTYEYEGEIKTVEIYLEVAED